MLVSYIIIALTVTSSYAVDGDKWLTTEGDENENKRLVSIKKLTNENEIMITKPYKNTNTKNDDNVADKFNKLKNDIEAKLTAMEKNMKQNVLTIVADILEHMEEQMNYKYNELQKDIEILEQAMDLQLMTSKNVSNKDDEQHLKIKDLENHINEIQREIDMISVPPGIPHIKSGERSFAIVEVNSSSDSSAYNDIIKKKDSVDIFITWSESGVPALESRMLLNGTNVWSGAGNASSASFKVAKGGRYQLTLELCNKKGCSNSSTEIIVADTDGSHLALSEFSGEDTQVFNKTSDKIVAAYYTEWVYPYFRIEDVPISKLTYLLYNYIPICGGDGINDSAKQHEGSFSGLQNSCAGREDFKVTVHNPYPAFKMETKYSPTNQPYKGNFGHLMIAKQIKPDLKILMSVGGLTLSDPFPQLCNETKRNIFIASVKDFLQTWKFFDGVDIMWVFPQNSEDGKIYIQLMKELRIMLDDLSAETGKKYELTSLISAKWDNLQVIDYSKVQKYIDHIFLWSHGIELPKKLGYYSNLYASTWKPQDNHTVDFTTKYLVKQGVEAKKIVLGLSLSGFSWTGVHNITNGNPFTGKANSEFNEMSKKDYLYYNKIPSYLCDNNWDCHYDSVAENSYMFNNETGDLITYEDPRSTLAKAKYVTDNKLGGMIVRGIDVDKGDILNVVNKGLEN